MRVLMLSWEFPPLKIGGIAEHVYELSGALARKGVEVHVVTPEPRGMAQNESCDTPGVHLHKIAMDFDGDFIRLMNVKMVEVASLMDFDLLHAHDWMVCDAALELRSEARKPLVSTIHSTEFGRSGGIKDGFQMRIHYKEEQLAKLSDHIIVCSESMKKEVMRFFNIKESRISVIPNGMEVKKFDFAVNDATRRIFSDSSKLILFVGRLVHQKGVNVLIGAMPKVLKKVPDVTLLIVGDGPMRQQLEKDAAFLGVSENVKFAGYLDDLTVRALYKLADVVVVPSLYEPFGIVALEAMAAKTPVIVSAVGGLSEIVGGEEGVKVPPDNSEALADAIVSVLTDADEKNRARVEAGYRKVKALGWDNIAEITLRAYARALHRRRLKFEHAKSIDYGGALKIQMWEYS